MILMALKNWSLKISVYMMNLKREPTIFLVEMSKRKRNCPWKKINRSQLLWVFMQSSTQIPEFHWGPGLRGGFFGTTPGSVNMEKNKKMTRAKNGGMGRVFEGCLRSWSNFGLVVWYIENVASFEGRSFDMISELAALMEPLPSASFRSTKSNWWHTMPPGSPASHKPWDGPPTWAQRINSSSDRMSWLSGWCARKQLGFGNWWIKWWFRWTCNDWAKWTMQVMRANWLPVKTSDIYKMESRLPSTMFQGGQCQFHLV